MKFINVLFLGAILAGSVTVAYPADASNAIAERDPPFLILCPTSNPDSNFSGCVEIDIENDHNPGVCNDWTDFFRTDQANKYTKITAPGFCVILHAEKGCQGTATGPISIANPQIPPDTFWQTHTSSFKVYRTVNGHC